MRTSYCKAISKLWLPCSIIASIFICVGQQSFEADILYSFKKNKFPVDEEYIWFQLLVITNILCSKWNNEEVYVYKHWLRKYILNNCHNIWPICLFFYCFLFVCLVCNFGTKLMNKIWIHTSPFKKQYNNEIKNPWKDTKKKVVYDQKPNVVTSWVGGSVITTKFVIPNNGSRIMAALTAFLEIDKNKYWQEKSLSFCETLKTFRNGKFSTFSFVPCSSCSVLIQIWSKILWLFYLSTSINVRFHVIHTINI